MIDTSNSDTSSVAVPLEEDYSPPVKITWDQDGRVRYVPVQWEKDLIMYDLTLSQVVYPDGSKGELRAVIKIDSSKNIIRDRFEILDI